MRPNETVTVLLPAHNEAATVEDCVEAYRSHPAVNEVIVSANACTDNTAQMAERAGANVVESKTPGKGMAVAAGARVASPGVVIVVDADAQEPTPNTIGAILKGKPSSTRLVKGTFARELHPGPVTDLLVKPCLELTGHPARFLTQPLSGVFACHSSWLARIDLPNDFGIDLEILLTAFRQGMKVKEVDIGTFTHAQRSWPHYQDMAMEVARVLHRFGILVNRFPRSDEAL